MPIDLHLDFDLDPTLAIPRFDRHLARSKAAALSRAIAPLLAIGVMGMLQGCVFESPYWAQTFDSTSSSIPLQTWTIDSAHAVKVECSKAYHGGLYPFGGPEIWSLVTNIAPSTNPSYDTQGGAIYSAGAKMALPAACWNEDAAYTPSLYMTALRATQTTANGSTTVYRVFDLPGLECLGRENGKTGNWFSWLTKSCVLTYSGSTTALPYVRIIAKAPGAAAGMVADAAPESARAVSSSSVPGQGGRTPAPVAAAELNKAFQVEPIDASWATARETRLRMAYDTAHPDGTTLLEAACRSTMCRVEVSHLDAAAQDRFVAALGPAGLFADDASSGVATHERRGQGVRSVYFIARDGVDFAARSTRLSR